MMTKVWPGLTVIMLLLAACGGEAASGPAATAVPEAAAVAGIADEAVEAAATVPAEAPEEDSPAVEDEADAAAPEAEGQATDLEPGSEEDSVKSAEDSVTAVPEQAVQPIEVTYFTPAQGEGPYYTVDKPADRDNDLLDVAGAAGEPQGERLYFGGVVYDANGFPVPGITVEIWQTDASGVYLHPGDPGTDSRDRNFQFYGESVTGADGVYSFRTIVPGHYEPRPRHIHVKVKRDGQELLTTQFYFADELDLQGNEAAMLIDAAPAEDDDGSPILVGERDIILSMPLVEG